MAVVLVIASVCLLALVLLDGFETMVLPRRVTRRFRLTRFFYRGLWVPWRLIAMRLPRGRMREGCLSIFGPLSILLLFACWMAALTVAFACLHWSLGTILHMPGDEQMQWTEYLYMSGTTIFTLGYGDVVPLDAVGRFLAVAEAGIGFGFLAVVIGYLPVLYQAFSRRETIISMLDARAGSPPSGGALLVRAAESHDVEAIRRFLQDLEQWSAEVLESHLSFPVLSFYRSQHDNQSWLAALTAALDACALIIAMIKDVAPYQAQLTFAMARHAAVDLVLVFHVPPDIDAHGRMTDTALSHLRAALAKANIPLHDEATAAAKFAELRAMYEPFVVALGWYFVFAVPPVFRETETVDNWQTSAWMRRTVGIGKLRARPPSDEHFA
ncbi:MAG TPA: potassium channel family protein [Pirellulales bacterium]|nr:potassium channel family protein [Pirellulales bacterium]